MQKLNTFLKQYECGKEEKGTHVGMPFGGIKSTWKWIIPEEDMEELYKIYVNTIGKINKFEFFDLTILEAHLPKAGPIIVDLDIQYEKMQNTSFNKERITRIVFNITEILNKYIHPKSDFSCIVTRRESVYEYKKKNGESVYKDGIHIYYPFLTTPYAFQYALRNIYLESHIKSDLEGIEGNINTYEKVYDKSVIEKNNWFLYYSSKPEITPYKICNVFSKTINITKMSSLEKVKLMSIRREQGSVKFIQKYEDEVIKIVNPKVTKKEKKNEEVGEDGEKDFDNLTEEKVKDLLALLSQERCDIFGEWIEVGWALYNTQHVRGNEEINFLELFREWSKTSVNYESGCCERYWNSMKYQKNGLTVASIYYWAKKDSPERYKNLKLENTFNESIGELMNQQIVIDKIHKNERGGNLITLDTCYCPFVKCEHEEKLTYIEMDNKGYVLRCLHVECFGKMLPANKSIQITKHQHNILNLHFGDVYNIKNYSDTTKKDKCVLSEIDFTTRITDDEKLDRLMLRSISGRPCFIAEVLHHLYKNTFNCTKEGVWYEFKGHYWVVSTKLRRILNTELFDRYESFLQFAKKHETLSNFTEKIGNLILNLATTSYKNNIMTEAAEIFYLENPEFFDKLDKDKYLLCFENGVYELKNYLFRSGKPEDYITTCIGYDYIEEPNPNDMIRTWNFINTIQTREEVRDYLLKSLSLCLSGVTVERLFFLNGGGSNGKSKLVKLIEETLGNYYAKIPLAIIIGKRNGGENASPMIASLKNKRCVVLSEPSHTDKLNIGIIKELTGGESISCRKLFSDPFEYVPQYKIFMLCNYLPEVGELDDGTWRRLRSVPFISKFVDNPNPKNELEFKSDPNLDEVLKELRQCFIRILLDYWKLFQQDGRLKDVELITTSTNQYKNENNEYQQFIELFIEKSEEDGISTSNLMQVFSNWFCSTYKKKTPELKFAKKYFVDNLFNAEPKSVRIKSAIDGKTKVIHGWKGFKLIDKMCNNMIEENESED